MTSPDLPQQPPANSANGDANHPEAAHAPQTHADADAQAPAQAAAHSEDDGPQPGNEKAEADHADDDGEEDGPAPGNEKFPQAQGAAGTPGAPGTGKRKRRRRKKGGANAGGPNAGGAAAGAAGAAGAEGAPAEGAEGAVAGGAAEGEGKEGAPGAGKNRKKDNNKKKDRPPRPERERPAFNVGDVTFGKIIEITEDAIFVDMSGKGKAIFDRREMDLPDEPPPGADDHHHHDDEDEDFVPGEPAEGMALDPAEAAGETPAGEPPAESEAAAELVAEAAAAAEAEAPAVAETPAAANAPAPTEAAAPAEASAEATPAEGTSEAAPAEGSAEAAPAEAAQPIWPAILLEVGQQFVGVVHNDGGRGGLIVLTRHPRRAQRAKLVVAGAFKEKGEVLGLVTGVIKGGVEVDVDGLRAFAPGSHMDLRLGADLHPLVGKRLMFQVTQYAKKGRDVVLSRRAFLETEAKAARAEALAKLAVGSIVEGTVRSVVSFGAFIDVGGIEGLVPLSEMSHNRGDGPHDVFKQNEKTPVKILRVDEKGKIWLSRKAAIPDPWGEVAKKYPIGSKHAGKVARLQPFGAFVELEPGIDGLIHTADLSIKRIEHPSEVVKEGDAIDVVVAHLDVGAHKIGLHPAPEGAAAGEQPQRVQLHKMAKVAVVGHDAGGLFVRILGATGRHARGFITAAATGTPRGTDLRKQFPLNTQLDAKVIEMDPRRSEIKLSIKAMQDDTERSAYRQYREQVTRESKFGTFADLLKKKDQPQK